MWIYCAAWRGGIPPTGQPPHAETRPVGGPVQTGRDVASDDAALLVIERCAMDVARLAIGFAGEAQDGGVVDEPIGDRDRLRRRRQELGPLLEREIRDDHGGALFIPGTHHAKELDAQFDRLIILHR
jgi:hypothetical protein